MSQTFVDQVNETPTTYAILLVYVTMAFLTDPISPSTEQLCDYGASAGLLVQDGEVWRLLSCAFLHGNWLHLLLNSYGLLILGPILERAMGTWRFCLLYALAALAGSVAATLINEGFRFLVGGSGALFGMMGAALAYNVRGGRTMLDFLENYGARQLISLIALNLLVGFFVPIVSNSAHIGGLIAGFVLVFCFLDIGRRNEIDATGRFIQAGWIAVLLGGLLYVKAPVLRYDYQLREYLRAPEGEYKYELSQLLDVPESKIPVTTKEGEDLRRREQEPKTGFLAVAYHEWELYGYVPKLRETVLRWKRER